VSATLQFPDRPLSPDNPSVWALTTHVEPFNAGSGPTNYAQLAKDPDTLVIGAITRDSNGAALSAAVSWPDGVLGTYTALTVSIAFPGAVDSYSVTYGSPTLRTYTQPLITRDASGTPIVVPAIVIS
jgi:hypothetical protein